jgi:hypothetical protein
MIEGKFIDLREGASLERQFARLLNAIRGGRNLPVTPSVPVGGTVVAPVAAVSVAPAPSPRPAPVPEFNTAAVRELLLAAFSDEELTTFCYDNFRTVYEDFATGMSRTQKIQMLVAYCERRGEMAELLVRVERANPYQYARFRDRLRN